MTSNCCLNYGNVHISYNCLTIKILVAKYFSKHIYSQFQADDFYVYLYYYANSISLFTCEPLPKMRLLCFLSQDSDCIQPDLKVSLSFNIFDRTLNKGTSNNNSSKLLLLCSFVM